MSFKRDIFYLFEIYFEKLEHAPLILLVEKILLILNV